MRIVVIALVMLAATPALADQGNTPAPATDTATIKPAKPKVICEVEDSTGTHLGAHKVCLTEDQWKQRARDSADWVQRSPTGGYAGKAH